MIPGSIKTYRMWSVILIFQITLIFTGISELKAQEPPPRPIRIYSTAQTLSFGAFYHGAGGGSITITPAGSRSSTGHVILLGLEIPFSAALFYVHAHKGTVVSILLSPPVTLAGTPSGSMTLHINSSNPTSPFVSTVNFNVPTSLYIGGFLTVGHPAANPPGSYTGTFDITIVRE